MNEKYLNKGKNTLEFIIENVYTNDGYGLHSFVDTDGLQYIYSHLEPNYANRMYLFKFVIKYCFNLAFLALINLILKLSIKFML